MNRILVWDVPTRVLHWLLTGGFAGALGIALLVDDDSPFFQMHMLLGLVVAFVVLLRVLWGFVGTRYARFGSFLFGPVALFEYLRGAVRRTAERHAGHNPGAAYATYAMLVVPLAIAFSGVFMARSEALEEVHEVLAWTMVAAVVVHVAGVAWHTIRHREFVARSMVDGKKEGEASRAIASSRPVLGVLVLALSAGFAMLLLRGHDAQRAQVTLFGQTIRLGESEGTEAGEKELKGEPGKTRRNGDGEGDDD